MRLSLELGGEELDFEVDATATATVGDLVAALAGDDATDRWLDVDGTAVEPSRPLAAAGLHDGARVALTGVPALVGTAPAGPARDRLPAAGLDPPPHGGAATWWRPPRAPMPPEPPPVRPPAEPPPVPEPPRLSWPTLAAPVVVAVALAALLDPRLAIIAVVGPVAQVASWADDRRRCRAARRQADKCRAEEAARVARDEAVAAAMAERRRLFAEPPVGELLEWATTRHPRLWERRPNHDDFLRLALGDVAGIGGPRAAALAVARGLVVRVTSLHGPADASIAIAADAAAAPDWDWAKWLPHLHGAARHVVGVVDVADPAEQRRALAAVAGAAITIVVGRDGSTLPDACEAVFDAVSLLGEGVGEAAARQAARALAALRDPDAAPARGAVPRLRHLLGRALPEVPIGTTADGKPFTIDLARDGPHMLIAGMTGSGKSELLRVLVAGLAAAFPPERVNFVLLDYKGGSAFDACGRLPHVAGLATDLDGALAARALRCLTAELRYREGELRDTGAPDIEEHNEVRDRVGAPPLPRLVVVIDEFAALAADVPEFVAALIGIAQRGRSLGVHLVLATQRPAGVVNDAIRANIDLRIALRVNDAGASVDVVGVPDAAAIPRHRPGRAIARLDADRIVPFDVAMVSAPADGDRPPVRLRPFVVRSGGGDDRATDTPARTDLDVLVDRVVADAQHRGVAPPRSPWPDPLPDTVALDSLGDGDGVPLGWADDPDHQRRFVYCWPGTNLLACGQPDSGATDALVTLAIALARAHPPERLHIYAIDDTAGALASLADLPHTGAVIGLHESERLHRLLRMLAARIDDGSAPTTLLTVADVPGLLAALDGTSDVLARIVASGPRRDVFTAVASHRPTAVPSVIAAEFPTRLVFRLTDPHDAALFGGRSPGPSAPSGRAVDVATGLEVQIAVGQTAAVVWPDGPSAPGVGVLPETVRFEEVSDAPAPGPGLWLPVGVADADLDACGLLLAPGEHALVVGGARSGKTTVLETIGAAASSAGVNVVESVDDLDGAAEVTLVLVDDADRVDDADGRIAALLAARHRHVHIVAAARTDALRHAYGHWTRELRSARRAIVLGSRPDDGDVFGIVLPRPTAPFPPGRGYLVTDGIPHRFQAAAV